MLANLITAPAWAAQDGPAVEVAGPRAENLVDAATLLAAKRGYPAKVEIGANPAYPDPDAEANANGVLLPGPGAILGGPTFESWPGDGGRSLTWVPPKAEDRDAPQRRRVLVPFARVVGWMIGMTRATRVGLDVRGGRGGGVGPGRVRRLDGGAVSSRSSGPTARAGRRT